MREAESGEQALEVLSTYNPKLVVLDVEMPKMDGFITCQQILQKRKRLKDLLWRAQLDMEILPCAQDNVRALWMTLFFTHNIPVDFRRFSTILTPSYFPSLSEF